jgi:hypothetical protein
MSAKQTRSDRSTLIFEGHKYQKYSDRPYYERVGGRYLLHREIWAYHNGEIPEGYHIHHLDGDTANNTLENLQCMPASEHRAEHTEEKRLRGRQQQQLEHLEKIRHLATEWHRSEEGRAWHKKHAEHSIKSPTAAKPYSKVVPVEGTCTICNTVFISKNPTRQIYCSNKCACKASNTLKRAKILSTSAKKCVWCSKDIFTVYSRQRFCTNLCKSAFGNAKRKAAKSV